MLTRNDQHHDGDADERPLTHAEILVRNAAWTAHQRQRLAKGRPAVRMNHQQYDRSRNAMVDMGVAPDPILDLYAARLTRRNSAYNAQRYGEVLQTVVSPGGRLP